ncbi:hypothetical protein NKG95_06725 [Mesorhizobium sp. M1423]|uniref:hypothetical protein n=1 Tax=Mesorhizobium sp. M1423 TaxID=2957101 RepID=UPI003338D4BE
MSWRLFATLAMFLALFMCGILTLLQVNDQKRSPPVMADGPKAFSGTLVIKDIRDITVAANHVILCGATFTKPAQMTALVSEAASDRFPPQMVTCKPVGLGTPCDGLVASRLNNFIVAQCFTKDGADLAEQLISQGILCGQPDQSGGHYKPCP